MPHALHLWLIKAHSEYASGLELIFIATLIDKFMQCHPLPIWRSTWHTVLGLLGAGLAACGMWHAAWKHVACVQVSLQVGKVRWLPFLFVQCSFSFYWQPVACGMWQLHRLEVDAAPPTSFECGHITWKWAKSHTDQTNTLTHTHARRGNVAMSRASRRVAGHANSRVFVGQHFRLRSGGGFDAIWWLWSWPPNQTSFKCAVAIVAACHMQHCSISALSRQMSFCGQQATINCSWRCAIFLSIHLHIWR